MSDSYTPQNIIPPELEKQVANLVATYEVAMDRLAQREKALEEQYETSEAFIDEQIQKVNALMADLREVMTEAGAARFRLSAQEALRLGDLQLQSLKKLSEETKQLMNDSCTRFEKTSLSSVKNVNEAITSFKVDDFKKYVEKSYDEVKKASSSAIDKMSDILQWFQWKNLALALGLSIVASVVVGLYIDDEWPWELHSKVVKERAAGQALMNAWPHLNQADQQYLENKILNLSKENS